MTNSKSTKRALVSSALAILMCMAMLIGTTFAWFTDTASTAVNKIQSGRLKMKAEYSADMRTWNEVSEDKAVFDENALWEPGHTEIVYFRVSNTGTLALRYNLDAAVNSYSPGINADGKDFNLCDYLMFGSVDTEAAYATREEAIAAIAESEQLLGQQNIAVKHGEVVLPGETSAVFALVLYMPTTVGNEANNVDKSRTPEVELGITINATQATVENDSFGNDYDEDAPMRFKRVEYSGGTHTVTESIMAPGRWGAVQVIGGTTTIEASVTATAKNDTAVAVWATSGWTNAGTIVINKGTFTQQGLGNSDHYDLIYASDGGKIIINGGTFKAATPKWTLNCKDGSNSTITVKGGTFYKFDPSKAEVGAGEIIVPDGYSVIQNGDWYTVIEGTVVDSNDTFNAALAKATAGSKIILNCDVTELTVAVDSIKSGIIIDGQGEFGLARDVYNALAGLGKIEIKNIIFLG